MRKITITYNIESERDREREREITNCKTLASLLRLYSSIEERDSLLPKEHPVKPTGGLT